MFYFLSLSFLHFLLYIFSIVIKINGLVFDLLGIISYLHVFSCKLNCPFSILEVVSVSKMDLLCSLSDQK